MAAIKRMKVMTLVGTRPEIIKLSRVIAELEIHTDHILVHSGQNYDYELNDVFFDQLGIRKPNHFLDAAGNSACETIANVLVKTEQLLLHEKPEAFLVYGDTNSCLASIAAKRQKIPVFHMEAGNRCFDERVPEEINRRILDHISDINMPLTEHGRRYLLREGVRPETVIKTGSCMQEVLAYYRPGIESSNILDELGLEKKSYFVVSIHREENVDSPENLQKLVESMDAVLNYFDKSIIFSVHPRTRIRLNSLGFAMDEDRVKIMKPLGFLDYIKLQQDAFCVISDSGTITEESSLLGFPAVTIRETHERPEGMDAGTLIMSGLEKRNVVQAVAVATSEKTKAQPIQDYLVDDVSRKVVHIILSYTDYVKRTVWRER